MLEIEVCIGSACYVKGSNKVVQDLKLAVWLHAIFTGRAGRIRI